MLEFITATTEYKYVAIAETHIPYIAGSTTPIVEPIETCQISPNDRDFRSLWYLINRYGQNGTLQTRSMTYMEFTTHLNILMDEMNDRLEQYSQSIDRNDITVIKTLQERFAPELAILRQRTGLVDIRNACNED